MKRILRSVSMFMLCMTLSAPMVQGADRGRHSFMGARQGSSHTMSQPSHPSHVSPGMPADGSQNRRPAMRPGSNGKPQMVNPQAGNNHPDVSRPETNRPGVGINNQRPGNSGRPESANPGANNQRPEGNRPEGNRPESNRPGNFRPGGNHIGNGHIGNNHRPEHRPGGNHIGNGHIGNNHRPGGMPTPPPNRPGFGFGHTHRPTLPPPRPYHRPVPPTHFHAYVPFSPLHAILGITFGTAINITLNQLVNTGYSVEGYTDNTIYVSNATQLNLKWPNATLYYSNGGLVASEFVYSTVNYDMTRYNIAYERLINAYGMPYSSTSDSGIVKATWWSSNGQYITLTYAPAYASNGSYRYYTTLAFGM